MNSAMSALIARCNPSTAELSPALTKVVEEGVFCQQNLVLLASQSRLVQSSVQEELGDETGYECFVNDLHLEDVLGPSTECSQLEQALAFGRELARIWVNAGKDGSLLFIIAGNEGEINIRFHRVRVGQAWLADDLETYREPVAAIELRPV